MRGMVKLPTGGWVTRPPEHCANGHPFTPGDVTSYHERWAGCWCAAAVAADDDRPGHDTFECKTCGHVTVEPPCTDPGQRLGWGASHGH